jgi:hypothetical protein
MTAVTTKVLVTSHILGQCDFASVIRYCQQSTWSVGSSVGIVSVYGLDDRAIYVRSPAEARDFSSSPCVQTGSGAHPASCPRSTGGPFPGAKVRPGRDADHSPHLVPRSWMSRSYTSSPPCACKGVLWDWFTFAFKELKTFYGSSSYKELC